MTEALHTFNWGSQCDRINFKPVLLSKQDYFSMIISLPNSAYGALILKFPYHSNIAAD